jgi:hypothetical protein
VGLYSGSLAVHECAFWEKGKACCFARQNIFDFGGL